MSSFVINTASINALESEVSKALYSTTSLLSNNCESSIGIQTLTFNKSLNIVFDNSAETSVTIGTIPTNCLIYSTVCYSSGFIGISTTGTVIIDQDRNSNFRLTVQGKGNGGEVTVLNDELDYPNMFQGQFNPQSTSSPFIASLSSNIAAPRHLVLHFSYLGTPALATCKGTVIIRMVLHQMNPNNTISDGYPTGGIDNGPVINSIPLPSL